MRIDNFTPPSAIAPTRHQPLGEATRLRFSAGACLPLRYPDQDCGLCVAACPVSAIALENDALVSGGECIGCGQCVAVCPTAALHTDGFALPAECPSDADTLYVDCWRVPLAESPRGAWRVPCLGGINTGWLLGMFDLVATARERPIRLLDRGACASCLAGAGIPALHTAIAETGDLLSACGVPAAVLPAPTFLLARQALTPAIPTSAGALAMDRRSFFRGLVGSVARSADDIKLAQAPDKPISLREPVQPVERLRSVAALSRIAARHGRPLPPRALPQLSLADCSAHGVCAAVCPTGALRRDEAGDTAELRFNAALCIACGQCTRSCPDAALRLTPEGGQATVEVLARWTAHECASCDETFFGAQSDLCPLCIKKASLHQGMAALFGRPDQL